MTPTHDQVQAAIQYAVVHCGQQAKCREVRVSIAQGDDGTVIVDAFPVAPFALRAVDTPDAGCASCGRGGRDA